MFYQLVLRQFSNFGFINLTQKLPIYDLLMISLEAEEEENGWDESLQSKEEIAKVFIYIYIFNNLINIYFIVFLLNHFK